MMTITHLQTLVQTIASLAGTQVLAFKAAHQTKAYQARAYKGQGIIEYAGAVVTSALVVGTLVKVAPHAYANMFGTVLRHVGKYVINIL